MTLERKSEHYTYRDLVLVDTQVHLSPSSLSVCLTVISTADWEEETGPPFPLPVLA